MVVAQAQSSSLHSLEQYTFISLSFSWRPPSEAQRWWIRAVVEEEDGSSCPMVLFVVWDKHIVEPPEGDTCVKVGIQLVPVAGVVLVGELIKAMWFLGFANK